MQQKLGKLVSENRSVKKYHWTAGSGLRGITNPKYELKTDSTFISKT